MLTRVLMAKLSTHKILCFYRLYNSEHLSDNFRINLFNKNDFKGLFEARFRIVKESWNSRSICSMTELWSENHVIYDNSSIYSRISLKIAMALFIGLQCIEFWQFEIWNFFHPTCKTWAQFSSVVYFCLPTMLYCQGY